MLGLPESTEVNKILYKNKLFEYLKLKANEKEKFNEDIKKLVREKDRTRVRKSGFRETDKVYKCYECDNCPYQKACNKYSKTENPQTKRIQFNEDFLNFRKESYENITSEEGINERLNRSIQAEGAFSKIKEAMGYDRFRHRVLKSILCDTYLLAMGLNLNQLHRKLLKKQTQIIKYKKTA